MTAERLEEIRRQYFDPEGYNSTVEELVASHDALTARVAELERERQYTCEQHRDEVRKGERCVWCELAAARGAFDLSESERQRLAGRINATEARKVEDGDVQDAVDWLRDRAECSSITLDPAPMGPIADLLTRLSAALKAANDRADKEEDLRKGSDEAADELVTAWKRRAQAAEAKLETARRDALEEAASECLILERDDAVDCPSGPAWKWYGKSRDHAAARIRALQTKDTTP